MVSPSLYLYLHWIQLVERVPVQESFMLRLFGFTTSSYYSMVKLTLLEKGLSFAEVPMKLDPGGQLEFERDYRQASPMGKVPSLQTDEGFLSETSVIIDYLDDLGQGPSFYPEGPFERAKVREIIKHLELYIELPARRLYGEFFGRPVSDDEKRLVRGQLEMGFAAIVRLARFDPYIAGKEITYADFFAQFALTSATRTTKAIYGWDTFNEVPGIRELLSRVAERETMQRIMADRKASQ